MTTYELMELAVTNKMRAEFEAIYNGLDNSDRDEIIARILREAATQLRTAASEGGEVIGYHLVFKNGASQDRFLWADDLRDPWYQQKVDEGIAELKPMAYTHPPEVARDAGRWLPIESAPEGKAVLLTIEYTSGRQRVIRAMRAGDKTMHLSEEQDPWDGCLYDEAEDCYYCAPGWYEKNEFDECNWAVCETPIAWQPLPATPQAAISGAAGVG